MNKKYAVMLVFCTLFSACTHIDNYVLGKDNTPQPSVLEPLTPKVNLVTEWSATDGKANKINTYLKLKPVIRGDFIYSANASGTLQATNKHSGKILWSKQLKNGIVSGPSIFDGYLAVGTNAASIVVFNQNTGTQVWRAKVSSDVLSKVAIVHNQLIAKTIDGNLYAFDLKTGEKIWVIDHGSPNLILKASSSPVVVNDIIFVGYSDGRLDAVDLKTGHLMWQRSIAYASGASDVERLVDIDADPVVRDNIVYLATYQGYVGALLLTDGQFIWNKPASIYKNIVVRNNALYFVDSQDIIWAMDKRSGQVRWKQLALKAHGLTEPVLMDKYLILGDKTGYVHILNTQNGELLGRVALNAPIDVSPAVSGKRIYVMTANGKLNCMQVSQI